MKFGENVPPEIAELGATCRDEVTKLILAGDRDGAHAAVRQAFARLAILKSGKSADDSICGLFGPAIQEILTAGGIESIGDLCRFSRYDLVQAFQIRYRSADLIDTKLQAIGFALRRD